jgi:hypothetical protein
VAVDAPANVDRWWPIVTDLAEHAGLVTSEPVFLGRVDRP